MKIRNLILVLLCLCFSAGLFAQVAADPNDYFYDDLVVWETMGLVNNLPPARPYPMQLVKSILMEVEEKGDATQRQIAESHYQRLFRQVLVYGGKTKAAYDMSTKKKQLDIAISFDINYVFKNLLATSISVDGWATNKLPNQEVLPFGTYSPNDIVKDNATAGRLYILPAINSSFSVGTPEYYANIGMMRGSWGPFHYNGVVVNPQALHAGQYSFALNEKNFGLNVTMYSITATPDEDSNDLWPEKYVTVHSVDYRPFEWATISILESITYGGRFEPVYMLPLSPYLISQGNTGFRDNSMLGGMFTVKPLHGFKVDGILYADDLSFNDMIKGKVDTKYRIAGQLGASYAPRKSGIFTLISLDYTMVTPYMYSHKTDDTLSIEDPNYQNYTHAGQNFGAALNPNSDRVNLKIKLRPLEDFDFDIVGTLIRHANVNEDIEYKWVKEYLTSDTHYITDGSARNSSGSNVGHAYFYSTPFLTQETIQYIWQTGFDATCRLPVLKTGGYMVFKLGYRFELNMNQGVNENIYDHDSIVTSSSSDAEIKARADYLLDKWRDNAKGRAINNYLSASFEYFY